MSGGKGNRDWAIVWAKHWSDHPVRPVADCPHPTTEVLTINQRLEPTCRGQHKIHMDGSICMVCGADRTGHLSLRDGLALCWEEHHWHHETAQRLYELAALHERELFDTNDWLPLWFVYAWGWEWPRIKASLEAALAEDAVAA